MLIDAYNAVAASPRLTGLKVKVFGDATALDQVGSNPRMVWIPSRDSFGPPDTAGDVRGRTGEDGRVIPLVIAGRQVALTSHFTRWCGCDIYLFTDVGPDGHRVMESLINEVVMAFYDEIQVPNVNFTIDGATWTPRGAISQKSIEVGLSVRVAIPIWATQPAQLLGAVRTNLT